MGTIVTTDGTDIFYKDWGSGQPVVFSHGWPLNADAWDDQAMLVASNGYRAIAHDRRGHGRSSQPWQGNDLDTYADDLAQLINTLGLVNVVLVGHSTGGGEVTRFADRHVDQPPTADPVTREAYAREVISFGFWFGDDRFSEPAFYAYIAPEPAGLAEEPLQPAAAWWDPRDGSHLAVLRYDDARATSAPRATVLDFYESAYQAGARLAGWDIRRLACPGGITDPHLRRHQDLSSEQPHQ